jgi:signal transduction histidine kinase
MSGRAAISLPLQVLVWVTGSTVAGTATGLVVGFLQQGGLDAGILRLSIVFANVAGLTVLAVSVALYPRLRTLPTPFRLAILFAGLLAGSTAGSALALYLFPLFVLAEPRRTAAVVAVNALVAVLVGTVAYVYEGMRWRLADTLREVEEVRLVEARLRGEAARAELAALQARINPHFFFNTLNTISSLLEDDPVQAESLVQTLADLFRYTFRAAQAGPVRLAEELDFVRRYLSIEQARFGDRLRAKWDVSADTRDLPVPGLILQPLVENAVGHGLAPVPRGGTVRIAARMEDGVLCVEVADDGAGLRAPAHTLIDDEHGLGNVRRRLAAFYGPEASLELAPGPAGRGAVSRLRIPVPSAVAAAGPSGEEVASS